MKIYLAADHGGFELKEQVKKWLSEQGYTLEDCGNSVNQPDDDYPDFAFLAAEKVSQNPTESKAMLFCRSGGGMVICANKVNGIRAVDVFDLTSAIHAKLHNNANIISLGADWMNIEEAKLAIKNFLETEFKEEERHLRRIQKITDYENSNK